MQYTEKFIKEPKIEYYFLLVQETRKLYTCEKVMFPIVRGLTCFVIQ